MTLEEANKIRDFVEGIEEVKEFLDFIKENKEENLCIYVNNPIYGCLEKKVPKTIVESLVSLSETCIKSMKKEIESM